MPQTIIYLIFLFLIISGIFIVYDIFTSGRRNVNLAILGLLLLYIIALMVFTDFPDPVVSLGGVSYLTALIIMLFFIILGMVANYFFYNETFNFREIIKPLFISPLILLPLIGTLRGSAEIENMQLISLAILSFQNGFFWKEVFNKAKPK